MSKIIFFLLVLLSFSGSAQEALMPVKGRINAHDADVGNIKLLWQKGRDSVPLGTDGAFTTILRTESDTLIVYYNNIRNTTLGINKSTRMPLLIELVNVKKLEEVIVSTGYQNIPKERATGSFTILSKKLVEQQVSTTLINRLEAITNGLYVDRITGGGSGGKLVIRGLSTIRGPRSPLIVLDNFPYAGNLDDINPNDVENITVLKDAAAASIWGAQAGNGVIVITTKRGKFNQKIAGTINTNVLLTTKPDLYKIKTLGNLDYIGFEKQLFTQGGFDDILTNYPYQAVSAVVEILAAQRNGFLSQQEADIKIAALGSHDVRNDFNKDVYQAGANFQQSLSLQGGSSNMAWDLSLGYDNNTGLLNDKYKRTTVRTNQNYKITRAFSISTGLDYTQSETNSGRMGYEQVRTSTGKIPIYTALADASGNALSIPYQYRTEYTDTLAGGRLLDWGYYPLKETQENRTKQKLQAIILNVGADYAFTKALSLRLKYQYGKQVTTGEQIFSENSYFARNYINSFTGYGTGVNLVYHVPKGAIIDNSVQDLETHNLRGQFNFNKAISQGEINAIAGAEVRQVRGSYNAGRAYGYDVNTLTSGRIDYTTAYPNLITGNADFIVDGNSFLASLNRFVSFFANAAYTYKNKYTISASGRRDASNLFGAGTNDKWTPLWSVGAGWDINKEKFFDARWASRLKLRTSYGVNGNADPSRSSITTLLYGSNSPYTQTPTAMIDQFKNQGLRWETVYTFNLGLDYESPNGRIQGSVDFYRKKATNLFGTIPVDYTGVANSLITKNVSKIKGSGWDFAINTLNLKGKFSWSTQLNLNLNHDKVITNYLTSTQGSNYVTGGTAVSAVPGRPVFALYAYRFGGLDSLTGDPLGYYQGQLTKNYGLLTSFRTTLDDLVYIGPALPTVTASIGNTFRYKNAAITLRVMGKFGGYFLRQSVNYSSLYKGGAAHPDYLIRWQQPGDEKNTTVPSATYPANSRRDNFYSQSEPLFSKAGSIRLQYITFSYDFTKPSLQAYINLNNVGVLWLQNKYGIDPEYNNLLRPSMNIAVGVRYNF